MAIADYDDFLDRIAAAQTYPRRMSTHGGTGGPVGPAPGGFGHSWGKLGGSTITTAVAPAYSVSDGAPGYLHHPIGDSYLMGVSYSLIIGTSTFDEDALVPTNPVLIVDRLSHQGGMTQATGAPVTTNLPTAALTRYTSGVGVWAGMWCDIGFANGTGWGTTTVTIDYTNSDGTSGRTGTLITTSSTVASKTVLLFTHAAGDKGVRSIESVSWSAAPQTSETFGLVLFKPLMMFPNNLMGKALWNNVGWNNLIDSGASLDVWVVANGTAGYDVTGTTSMINGTYAVA